MFWDVMMAMLTWRDIKISNSRQKINSLGFMMKMSREVIFRSMTRPWLLEGKGKISNNLWEKMPRDVRWKCDWAVPWLHVTHSWLLEGNYKISNNVWEKNALGCKMEMWLNSSMITWKGIKFSNYVLIHVYFKGKWYQNCTQECTQNIAWITYEKKMPWDLRCNCDWTALWLLEREQEFQRTC